MANRPKNKPDTLQPGSNKERDHRSKISELEYENKRLRVLAAEPEPGDLTLKSRRLLERANKTIRHLTQTVVDLEEASDPASSTPIAGNPNQPRRADSSKDEGSPTRWHRELLNRIHREVTRLCDEYDLRIDDKWIPPERPPKVRCMNEADDCEAYGKRIPKYVGPQSSRIELSRCPKCDKRLYAG